MNIYTYSVIHLPQHIEQLPVLFICQWKVGIRLKYSQWYFHSNQFCERLYSDKWCDLTVNEKKSPLNIKR